MNPNTFNVKHVLTLSTNVISPCEHCDRFGPDSHDRLAQAINHYLEAHGYRLLHIGQDTTRNNEGELWHATIAILGHDDPPPQARRPGILGAALDELLKDHR
jgi:hypothetical protein